MILLAKISSFISKIERWLDYEEPEDGKYCEWCGEFGTVSSVRPCRPHDEGERILLCPICLPHAYTGPPPAGMDEI